MHRYNSFRSPVLAAGMLLFSLTLPSLAQDLPHVVILATGGTIASTAASATDTSNYSVSAGVEQLIAAVPSLNEVAEVSGEQLYNVPSTLVTDVERIVLAKRINELLAQDDVDGIVVTHGTETLEQTAYFLDLTVKSDKPVVVVGAMRPASAISADGPMNIYDAVKVAGAEASAGKGVLVVMNDRIGAARYINKTSNWATDTFDSLEQGYLGDVVAGEVRFYQTPTTLHTLGTELDVSDVESLPQVHVIYASYGPTSAALVDAAIADGAKGIVIVGALNGEADERLQELVKSGDVVAAWTFWQASGQQLYDSPYIRANSLTPLKARILLQLALSETTNVTKIQEYFDNY